MTAIERTAYPRLKSRYTPKELADIFLPSPHDLNFIKQVRLFQRNSRSHSERGNTNKPFLDRRP